MAKKTHDLKPDTVLKNNWNDNGRFADFFNAVLFDGGQVISADELEDADTEESSVMEQILGTGPLPCMRCWIFRIK